MASDRRPFFTVSSIIFAHDCIHTQLSSTNPQKRCRCCDKFDETVNHLVSGCPVLAPKEYTDRHDKVGQYIHWTISKHFHLPHADNRWEHHPESVVEGENVTVLLEFSIHTDRTIKANRPDIVIKDKINKTCQIIDMAVPSYKNIFVKEFDKLSKYKDLQIEITKMWHLKTTIIPVVIGALGLIKRALIITWHRSLELQH